MESLDINVASMSKCESYNEHDLLLPEQMNKVLLHSSKVILCPKGCQSF